MIYHLYEADVQSSSESTSRGNPRASNVPHVTQIGGGVDGGNTATDVYIITITSASTLVKNQL